MARKGINIDLLKEHPELLLNFMREMRKAAFYNSNIFFRDVQFILRDFWEAEEEISITIPEAERYAAELLDAWEKSGVVRRVNKHAWLLLHQDYLTPKEGTVGLLNVPISKLPESAIPLPGGMPQDATRVAPTPIDKIGSESEEN